MRFFDLCARLAVVIVVVSALYSKVNFYLILAHDCHKNLQQTSFFSSGEL